MKSPLLLGGKAKALPPPIKIKKEVIQMKKFLALILVVLMAFSMFLCVGCTGELDGTTADTKATLNNANTLQENQPTPTDIDYSLERYNLIRRTYWVNGQREKANMLPCGRASGNFRAPKSCRTLK